MKKAYKIEISPTQEQKSKIHQTIGVSRFIYNFYISHNKEVYEKEGRFVSGMDFSKWLNNEYIPNNEDKAWRKSVSSKSTKQAIMNGEKAFKRFFTGVSGFPRFKKKKNQDVKCYFPKNAIVKSGTVSQKAGRYYVSILCEVEETKVKPKLEETGLGIDLGIKDFAICSTGEVHENINKTDKVRKLERKLKREQRSLSQKYENLKKRGETSVTNKRANIDKNILRIQKLHARLSNIRLEYIKAVVNTLVKTKPTYITIEDLNVKGMMKNKHLSKAVAGQCFYTFQTWLLAKCKEYCIELRQVDRFYPSSKLCSCCGHKKVDLKLSDRVYTCECGNEMDRDLNACINLLQAKEYTILT
ncbi:transposase [Bacillus cereus]